MPGGSSTRAAAEPPHWKRRWPGSASSTRWRRSCASFPGEWKDLPLANRQRGSRPRRERSRPLLDQLPPGWKAKSPRSCPRVPFAGRWTTRFRTRRPCAVYPDDGALDIDNNEGENAVRGISLGRKNWLFCGSDRGGRAAAIHFSLLASCKRHDHDPWVYLRDVLTRLPAMLPGASEEDLLSLLPHLWKPA